MPDNEKNFWDIEYVGEEMAHCSAVTSAVNADVAIIGGGGGGLVAAVRAVECGAKNVVILEKGKTLGGTARCAMGIFAVESNAQHRKGIHHTADECFERHMYVNQWSCDAQLVRRWIKTSGRVINWLEGHGMDFDDVGGCTGPIMTYHMCHHRTGLELVTILADTCKKMGVLTLTETRATELITEKSGAVCGVKAQVCGQEILIHAKSVIIATGSVANNKEALKKLFPDRNYHEVKIMGAMPFATGDGYEMAVAAGAGVGRVSPNYIGPHNHPRDVLIGCLLRRPHMMIVNKLGERYVNEDIFSNGDFGWMSGKALEEQPGKICFPIMDEACFRDMIAHKVVASEVEGNQSRHDAETGLLCEDLERTAWLDKVEARMPKEMDAGMMKVCATLDEAAQYIGCDPDMLKASADRYNGFCDDGKDNDFLKDPKFLFPVRKAPFYVFKGLHGIDNFIGGIKINHRLQVVDAAGAPILGLYACGIATSGWLGYSYGHAGTEMGLTTFSGYAAGEAAAQYAMMAEV